MNGREFDRMLRDKLEYLSPEEIPVSKVNPWGNLMFMMAVGIALVSISIDAIQLTVICPAIGTVLVLLALRRLRLQNRWMRLAWFFCIIRLLVLDVLTVLYSTMLAERLFDLLTHPFTILLSHLPWFLLLLCLWQGLLEVQRQAGKEKPSATPAAILLIWNFAVLAVGLLDIPLGWPLILVGWPLYLFVVYHLYRMNYYMNETGYAIRIASVRLPNWLLGWGCCLTLLAAVFAGIWWFGSYAMQWTEVTEQTATEAEKTADNLHSLGFPDKILKDLTDEDLRRMKNADRVSCSYTLYTENSDHELRITGNETYVREEDDLLATEGGTYTTFRDLSHYPTAEEAEPWDLLMGSVAVHIPARGDAKPRCVVLSYFRWLQKPYSRGTECLSVRGAWYLPYYPMELLTNRSDLAGRLLCDEDGKTYTADYCKLEHVVGSNSECVMATFSLPKHGEASRGYLLYQTQGEGKIANIADYTHSCAISYPFCSAETAAMVGLKEDWDSMWYQISDCFTTYQCELPDYLE